MFGWLRKKPAPANGPDYAWIDSPARAEEAVRRGEVEKLFMVPLEFGGAEIPENTLYVPPWVGDVKAGLDNNVIRPLAEEGVSVQYSVVPEYEGRSLVPIALTTRWARPGDARSSRQVINIWGAALARDKPA